MKNIRLKTLLTGFVLYALVLLTAGCPSVKKSHLEKAFNYNEQVSKAVAQSAVAVGDLYMGQVISYELKEKITEKLKLIQKNNDRVLTVLRDLKRQFGDNVPKEEIGALDVFFSQSIIAVLAEILVDAGRLSPDKAQKIYLAIAVLKQIVFTISNYFGEFSKESVSYRHAEYLKENYANV